MNAQHRIERIQLAGDREFLLRFAEATGEQQRPRVVVMNVGVTRLGTALTPVVLSNAAQPGPLDLDAQPVVCQTTDFATDTFTRRAYVDASFSAHQRERGWLCGRCGGKLRRRRDLGAAGGGRQSRVRCGRAVGARARARVLPS